MGVADSPGAVGEGASPFPGATQVPAGNVGRRRSPAPGEDATFVVDQARAAAFVAPPKAVDPLARRIKLPSGGLFYQSFAPGHDGQITIWPTRGEQEEAIAGAGEDVRARTEVMRFVTEQCSDLGGVPFKHLLVDDWFALTIHLLGLSAGTDEVTLKPLCPHKDCKRPNTHRRALTMLPCVNLRLAEAGESPTPTATVVEDDLIAAIEAIDAGEDSEAISEATDRVLSPAQTVEPFTTAPLPVSGTTVSWRYLRLSDLSKAEEFVARTGDTQTKPGSGLHSYLMALQIVAIDGRRVATLEAVRWVKQQPTVVLNAWREEMAAKSFGFNLEPTFRCTACKRTFQARLPLDGSIFRRRAGTNR